MTQQSQKEFLGLVAEYKRSIHDGTMYDKYFPQADGVGTIVNRDGSVKDTVNIMAELASKHRGDCRGIAKDLKGDTLEESCRNIWNFCHDYMQYKLDKEGTEQLRRPNRSWHDGQILSRDPKTAEEAGIDCDCYSIFIASTLLCMGIVDFKFKIVKYEGGWQHVYIEVPDRKNHTRYIIDCVLDEFNTEKPFTNKFYYNMREHYALNGLGIPIEVLSGYSVQEELDRIMSGHDFHAIELGATEPTAEDELTAIYNHLVRTAKYVRENPASVLMSGGAVNTLKMLDYAIQYWNTPQRDAALDALEKAEIDFNGGVSGLDDEEDDDEGVFGNALGKKKKTKAKKNFFTKVKEAVKKVGKGLKKVGKAIIRFNPITIAVRAGFLLGLRLNLFGIAAKLHPGATGSSDPKSSAAYAKIKKMFVDVLQGKEANLKKVITEGRAKKQFAGFATELGALGEPATITAIAAGAAPLVKAGTALDDAGVTSEDKKKFGTKIKEFFQKVGAKIKGIFKKKKNADGTESDEEELVDETTDTSTEKEKTSETETPAEAAERKKAEAEAADDEDEKGVFAKAADWIGENPGKATGIGIGAAALITLAVSPKARQFVFGAKKVGALSGVKIYRAKRKLKSGKMLRKGSRVKSISLAGKK